jgi:hypothetical protein
MERLEGGGGVSEAFWTGVVRKMSQGEKRRYSTCRLGMLGREMFKGSNKVRREDGKLGAVRARLWI